MATLTIRNLSDRAHDALRRRAAENRRSMEAEARLLIESLDKGRANNLEEVIAARDRLLEQDQRLPPRRMLASEQLIADRRIEALYEAGAINLEERLEWSRRIDAGETSLGAVETLVAERLS